MPTDEITPTRLRRLAEVQAEGAMVVSLFLDLDPAEFATPPARATAVHSLANEAGHRAEEAGDLTHDAQTALRDDVEKAHRALEAAVADPGGARAIAVYCCSPAGLLEVVRLPESVDSQAVVAPVPHLEPLAAIGVADRWAVVLVNRRVARILTGSLRDLEEVAWVEDGVHGQHDQGGWSQARFERGIENEVQAHLVHVADELFALHDRAPLDCILVGATEELAPAFEARLHPYLSERLAGRLSIDVENATVEAVREAAASCAEELATRRERAALDRLREGVARGGRGAAGVDDTLRALNEQRVEILLVGEHVRASGARCPQCGYLTTGDGTCPADGTALVTVADLVAAAVERATLQAAETLVVRRHDDLGPLGGVGAVLRF